MRPKGCIGRTEDKRRPEKGKMKQKMKCNISLEDKLNRTDPNSLVKKELWLK